METMKDIRQLLLLGLIFVLISSCNNNKPENDAIVRKVKVATIEKASDIETKEFSGIIKESRAVNLSFRVAGPIKAIYVKQGDFVKQGALVAEMDPRDYQLQLSVAQAEYNKVTTETSRVIELYKQNAVTETDYQKVVAGEKMITAQLNRAKDQLNDTKLYAPFSGYIQNINFQKGEIVNIGMPIADLLDVNSYQVEVDIPSKLFVERDKIKKVTCKLNINDATEIPLQLLNYQAKANSSLLYRMYYGLGPQSDKRVFPGMEVAVTMEYKRTDSNDLVIPLGAIFYNNEEPNIWIVNKSDSIVNKYAIEIGEIYGDGKVSIKSGLKGDETIVVSGVNSLKDNEKVEIIEPISETNIGGLL